LGNSGDYSGLGRVGTACLEHHTLRFSDTTHNIKRVHLVGEPMTESLHEQGIHANAPGAHLGA